MPICSRIVHEKRKQRTDCTLTFGGEASKAVKTLKFMLTSATQVKKLNSEVEKEVRKEDST